MLIRSQLLLRTMSSVGHYHLSGQTSQGSSQDTPEETHQICVVLCQWEYHSSQLPYSVTYINVFLLIVMAGQLVEQLPHSWQVLLTATLIYPWGPLRMSP